MRAPDVFTASEIVNWTVSEEYKPNYWRPARQCPFSTFQLKRRFLLAWRVLTGRYDALNWEGSGEKKATEISYKDCTDPFFTLTGKI